MDDKSFISKLNHVTRKNRLLLPIPAGREPSGVEMADWAAFFEACVREGVSLADPRWQRVSIESSKLFTRFSLTRPRGEGTDSDFRVGLKLLMSMFQQGSVDGKDD